MSDCPIGHARFEHIGGFLWLLRPRISAGETCRVYGTPGIRDHVRNHPPPQRTGLRRDRHRRPVRHPVPFHYSLRNEEAPAAVYDEMRAACPRVGRAAPRNAATDGARPLRPPS